MTNHIAYICDNKYAMPTLVSIISLVENTDHCRYRIHILTNALSSDEKERFRHIINSKVDIVFHEIELQSFHEKAKEIRQHTHVTLTALIKFELPNCLDNIDKVLYLDSDIIIQRDIYELFDINLEEKYAACASELWRNINNDSNDFYFNSGVMLLNLKYMREHNISGKLWEEKARLCSENKSRLMDQDTFNNIFKAQVIKIDVLYNFNPYFLQQEYISIVNSDSQHYFIDKQEILDSIYIIHYVGKEDKPWVYSTARLGEIWDRYYQLTGNDPNNLERKEIKKGLVFE